MFVVFPSGFNSSRTGCVCVCDVYHKELASVIGFGSANLKPIGQPVRRESDQDRTPRAQVTCWLPGALPSRGKTHTGHPGKFLV